MTVKELKEALAAYPDETELLIQVTDANGNTLISFFKPELTPTKITDELNDEKDAVVFDGLFFPANLMTVCFLPADLMKSLPNLMKSLPRKTLTAPCRQRTTQTAKF